MSLGELSGALVSFQAAGPAGAVLGAAIGMLGGILDARKHQEDFFRGDTPTLPVCKVVGDYQSGAGLERVIDAPQRHKPSRTPDLPRSKRHKKRRAI